jgi:glycosyltransferase involved in cell wall biosynthesis
VLQVLPALETGGAERTAIDIAAALVARGDRALVASSGGLLEPELAAVGGEHVTLPLGSKRPLAIVRNAGRLAALMRREHVDLVHARSRAPAWSAHFAASRLGTPFVTTYHGAYSEGSALKRFYNSVMARGDAVIANSAFTARLIVERHGTPADRLVTIPRGTDLVGFRQDAVDAGRRLALRRAWDIPEGMRVVLHLARLTPWKGQNVLLDAAALPALAAREDVVVVIAGDARGREDYRAALAARIATEGMGRRVRLVGRCDDVPAAFANADVAVAPAVEPEAFGRVAVEAAAMRLPVVATALGATAETVLAPPAVPDGLRTGWLVPPADPAALAAAIAAALDLAPAERQALGLRAEAHAAQFSRAVMQAATLAVYDRLLGIAAGSPQGA